MLPRNGLSIKDFFQAMSALFPAMRFSWEIKSVDAVFCNGLSRFSTLSPLLSKKHQYLITITRVNDLSKEAILQCINEGDLRFLAVTYHTTYNLPILFSYLWPPVLWIFIAGRFSAFGHQSNFWCGVYSCWKGIWQLRKSHTFSQEIA